ncbi:hypothetical protein [Halolamina sediminis]|uniref:hypothetical protein n=1 Tax=Halolamina sediminis TaxID=1480675 RepID=UPI0006B484BE|nr:hypothetical protein [Halolamina sediminis]
MFDWLFPGWTAPGVLTALVVTRTLCNLGLTAAIREASESVLGVVAGGALTVASTVLTVGILRGTFGITVSHVESILQLALLMLAGVVVLREGSTRGRSWAILAGAGAVLLYLFSIPLFGEATVAP